MPTLLSFIPQWAPNVHPILVHFPIAIFFFAALMDFLSFFIPISWWGQRKTAITYFIGAIFVVIVFFTGKMAAHSLDIPKYAYHAVGEHAGWAHYTVWFFGIYGVLRLILAFFERFRNTAFHVVMFLISLVGLYFLYETGEHGGKLVFGYGLGTGKLAKNQTTQMVKPKKPGFHTEESGATVWMVGKDANQNLKQHFKFIQGDTASMHAMVASGEKNNHALEFKNPDFFFVTDGDSYADVQIKMNVRPGNYKGDIMLTHNVHDAQNYAYMVLHPDGSAELGRVENGKNSIIEKGSYDPKGLKHIKLGVSGDHIHGYVNGKGILHGHSDQTGAGAIGLKLSGKGTFGLVEMDISKISGDEHGEDPDHDGDEH